ncbi:L,D-transpeptidase family protein [Pontibacterium granulatum]|uniref:L,D-transpeptidase family protein n=1 Tax=Pontibacterium granulatum TaxID=2036029 RepID=UPI00249C5314|nr:L,D-transpeptidase family protein [Pontibacterium granulatum]MDI3325380.1 L,D-transpeptidase family protein [Pontibacterium granulatum]
MKTAYLPAFWVLLCWASSGHGLDLNCGSKERGLTECAQDLQHATWSDFSAYEVHHSYPPVSFNSIDAAISHYRTLAQSQSWTPLQGRFLLREGMKHPQVARIRDRLRILGDYSYDHPLSNKHFFDSRLVGAVIAFQRRHGLKVDGIVGPNTRKAMNISPRERWQQLLVNKQRELVDQVAKRPDYIEINIPDYQLRYYRNGKVLTQMRVIVGKKDRPTPVMNSTLKALEVNPDWNVPKRIAYEDILPKLQGGRGAFDKLGVKLVKGWDEVPNVVSVDELDMNHFYRGKLAEQHRFWQPPGASNPLGQLKFIFPNAFSIYMHGTPGMHLFDEPRRTFSSGCIRIEDPMGLARLLLESSEKPALDLDAELESEAASISGLPGEVEIFTRYRTAWIDPDSGVLQFRADIYQRDPNELAELSTTQQQEPADTVTN